MFTMQLVKKRLTKQELHVIHHWFSLVVFKRSKISVLLLWEFESDIHDGVFVQCGIFFFRLLKIELDRVDFCPVSFYRV